MPQIVSAIDEVSAALRLAESTAGNLHAVTGNIFIAALGIRPDNTVASCYRGFPERAAGNRYTVICIRATAAGHVRVGTNDRHTFGSTARGGTINDASFNNDRIVVRTACICFTSNNLSIDHGCIADCHLVADDVHISFCSCEIPVIGTPDVRRRSAAHGYPIIFCRSAGGSFVT